MRTFHQPFWGNIPGLNDNGLIDHRSPRTCQLRDRNGQDYQNSVNKSQTGKQCRPWEETTHRGGEGTSGSHNFCRNPDNEKRYGGGVWCYVSNPDKQSRGSHAGNGKWEHCSVPWCNFPWRCQSGAPLDRPCHAPELEGNIILSLTSKPIMQLLNFFGY